MEDEDVATTLEEENVSVEIQIEPLDLSSNALFINKKYVLMEKDYASLSAMDSGCVAGTRCDVNRKLLELRAQGKELTT